MVAMQMRDENRVDVVRVEPKPAHADQRGGAAIDEEGSKLPSAHGRRFADARPAPNASPQPMMVSRMGASPPQLLKTSERLSTGRE